MRKQIKIVLLLLLFVAILSSCRKIKDYFVNPETEVLSETVQICYAVAYSSNLAIRIMNGEILPNVNVTSSCTNFPCISLFSINMKGNNSAPYLQNKLDEITIAGLWVSKQKAILSILFTNINLSNRSIELLGVHTIPVIKKDGRTFVVFARMDISLNPEKDAILTMDLSDKQIESELLKVDEERPTDLYIVPAAKTHKI
jgi:hypothetical protein